MFETTDQIVRLFDMNAWWEIKVLSVLSIPVLGTSSLAVATFSRSTPLDRPGCRTQHAQLGNEPWACSTKLAEQSNVCTTTSNTPNAQTKTWTCGGTYCAERHLICMHSGSATSNGFTWRFWDSCACSTMWWLSNCLIWPLISIYYSC